MTNKRMVRYLMLRADRNEADRAVQRDEFVREMRLDPMSNRARVVAMQRVTDAMRELYPHVENIVQKKVRG